MSILVGIVLCVIDSFFLILHLKFFKVTIIIRDNLHFFFMNCIKIHRIIGTMNTCFLFSVPVGKIIYRHVAVTSPDQKLFYTRYVRYTRPLEISVAVKVFSNIFIVALNFRWLSD